MERKEDDQPLARNNDKSQALYDLKGSITGKLNHRVSHFFHHARSNRQHEIDKWMILWIERSSLKSALKCLLNGENPICQFIALCYLDKLRVDLEWGKHLATYCNQKVPAVTSWSRFDKKYALRQPSPFFSVLFIVYCFCFHVTWYHTGRHLPVNRMIEFYVMQDLDWGWKGKLLQMITKSFFHSPGLKHIMSNMFGMLLFGISFERIHGFTITALIALFSAIGSSMTSIVLDQAALGKGASGIVYGMRGAIYADLWTNWDLVVADCERKNPEDTHFITQRHTIFICLVAEFFAELCFTLVNELYGETNISHSGHLGGLVFGFCLALPFLKYSRDYDYPISNNHRSSRLRKVTFFGGFSLYLGMAFHIWSFDGSPPLLCPCCFHPHSYSC